MRDICSKNQGPITIRSNLDRLSSLLSEESSQTISPQLKRKLQILVEVPEVDWISCEFVQKISSIFKRLLLELIQIQFNTKQREQDAKRIIESQKCTLDPGLIDNVMRSLVKLFRAKTRLSTDTSYERNVIIKFLMNELQDERKSKKQIEEVVQTLYSLSFFDIMPMVGSPARLKLKSDLCNVIDVRLKFDFEMIKLAQSKHIRLSPESWAFLLHRDSNQETMSRMQSLIDKDRSAPRVDELEYAISKMSDKFNLKPSLNELQMLENLLDSAPSNCTLEESFINNLLTYLLRISDLFALRYCRRKVALS